MAAHFYKSTQDGSVPDRDGLAWFVVLRVMLLAGLRMLLFGIVTIVFIPMVLLASWRDPEGRRAYAVARWWAWLNVRLCGVTVRAKGLAHLDPARSYVFMANHESAFDVLTLMVALSDFQLRWVAKQELGAKQELEKIPGFGQGLSATKPIFVDRHDHATAVATLAAARARIQGGVSAVFFPEGTRNAGRLLPFKKGGVVFAIETGTPIVPIRINGGHSLLDRTSILFRSEGTMEVIAQYPIDTTNLTLADRDTLLAQVRAAIADAAAIVRPPLEAPQRVPRPVHAFRNALSVLLLTLGVQGCAAIPLAVLAGSLADAGGGVLVKTGTEYTASGTARRTFYLSSDEVHAAVLEAFQRAQIVVVRDVPAKHGRVVLALAEGRKIRVQLLALTPVLTAMELDVKRNVLASDKATASELVAQTEHVIAERSTVALRAEAPPCEPVARTSGRPRRGGTPAR